MPMFRIAPGPPQSGSWLDGRTHNSASSAKCGHDACHVRHVARGDPMHRIERQRHGARHRHVQPHQTLQALRRPMPAGVSLAMGVICVTAVVMASVAALRHLSVAQAQHRAVRRSWQGVSPSPPLGRVRYPSILVRSATEVQILRIRLSRFSRLRRTCRFRSLTCTA